MRLRDVEVFNAVMQCGSVKGAAALLHVTQPATSRLLQQAERRAGFALFRRTRGRLVPTGEAQALYAEVEQLYARLEAIRRLVDSLALGAADMLREQTVAHGCDLGIALDGDADRVLIADEKGELLDGDQLLAMVAASWSRVPPWRWVARSDFSPARWRKSSARGCSPFTTRWKC